MHPPSKYEGLRDTGNNVLLQNATYIILKCSSCFITKCAKRLLQNVTVILSQNVTVYYNFQQLLQNASV